MPIEYQELTREQYRRRASVMIQNFEGFESRVYDAGDRMATIGFGYTLNRNDNLDIWDRAGVQLSADERRQLAAIDAAPATQKTALGLAFPVQITKDEARTLLEEVSLSRYETVADRLSMPNSDERAAVVSITYNRGQGAVNRNMQGFTDAVEAGDRAEAWYQLRYNSVGERAVGTANEIGIRARRNMESHVFGLYGDPANVTSEEARNVYRMFNLHRDDIRQTEQNWGVDFDGQRAPRAHDALGRSNANWPELSREYGQVPTIAEALEPARLKMLADLQQQYPDLADRLRDQDFEATAIYLDPGRDLRAGNGLRADQRNNPSGDVDPDHAATLDSMRTTRGPNPREIDSNDLLIGEGGDDTLRAHRGDDILIGGTGRDRMEGGVGKDTYAVGGGDTVMDSDGHGELRWNGRVLDGGVRNAEDPANTWRSPDGEYSYRLDDDTLTIADRQGESMQVEHYVRGDLGLRLGDAPVREGAGGQSAQAQGAQPQDAQAPNAPGIERLNAQDRAVYDRMRAALDQASNQYSAEQRDNIAAAGLAEFKRRETLVQQPQDIGVYGDRLFVTYFPHGRDREPSFHANVRLDAAANAPARDSLQQVDTLNRERAVVAPPQVEQGREQSPVMGARGL